MRFTTLLLHVHKPLIRYDTGYRTWMLRTQLLHVLIPLLYSLTGLHALIVYVFLLYGSWFILLLHEYSCSPVILNIVHVTCTIVTWVVRPVFLLHDYFPYWLIFSLLDMWAFDMRCVELSAMWIQAIGVTSRIPHLLFPVFRYLILCYQESSCPIICYMYYALFFFLIYRVN